jgi:hypothetical protein
MSRPRSPILPCENYGLSCQQDAVQYNGIVNKVKGRLVSIYNYAREPTCLGIRSNNGQTLETFQSTTGQVLSPICRTTSKFSILAIVLHQRQSRMPNSCIEHSHRLGKSLQDGCSRYSGAIIRASHQLGILRDATNGIINT